MSGLIFRRGCIGVARCAPARQMREGDGAEAGEIEGEDETRVNHRADADLQGEGHGGSPMRYSSPR